MNWYAKLLFAGALILTVSGIGKSQSVIIRLDKPFRAGNLSGFVFAKDGSGVPTAQVELMGAGWKTVLATRETNYNGFFRFTLSKAGLYYLRLTARGFQTYELKVRVKKGVR